MYPLTSSSNFSLAQVLHLFVEGLGQVDGYRMRQREAGNAPVDFVIPEGFRVFPMRDSRDLLVLDLSASFWEDWAEMFCLDYPDAYAFAES